MRSAGFQRCKINQSFAIGGGSRGNRLSGEFDGDAFAWIGGAPDGHFHALLQNRIVGNNGLGITSARTAGIPQANVTKPVQNK